MGNLSQKSQQQQFSCEVCHVPLTLLINDKFNNTNIRLHPFCSNCVVRYLKMKRNHLTCHQSLKTEIAHQLFDTWCDELFASALLQLEDGSEPNSNLDCNKPFEEQERDDDDDEYSLVVLSDTNGLIKCPNCRQLLRFFRDICTANCIRCRFEVCYKCGKEKGLHHSCNHQTLVTCFWKSLNVFVVVYLIYILYLIFYQQMLNK